MRKLKANVNVAVLHNLPLSYPLSHSRPLCSSWSASHDSNGGSATWRSAGVTMCRLLLLSLASGSALEGLWGAVFVLA